MDRSRLMKLIALLEIGDTVAVSALGSQLVGRFGGYDADDETFNIELDILIRSGRSTSLRQKQKLGIEVCDIHAIRLIEGAPGQQVHVQVTDVKTGKDVTVEVDFTTGKVDIDLKDSESTSQAYVKVAQSLYKALLMG